MQIEAIRFRAIKVTNVAYAFKEPALTNLTTQQ